jgi:hypothetical protein
MAPMTPEEAYAKLDELRRRLVRIRRPHQAYLAELEDLIRQARDDHRPIDRTLIELFEAALDALP